MINLPVPKPYLLRYENVRKIEFNYPSQAPLFYNPGWDIGDWGYDEVTAADKNFLRHDILFSSGATILLEFEKLRVTYPH